MTEDESIKTTVMKFDKEIAQLVQQTFKDGKERGFVACNNDGKICIKSKQGSRCQIRLSRRCKNREDIVFTFHTHLQFDENEKPEPSTQDWITGWANGDKVMCIGNTNGIGCYRTSARTYQDVGFVLAEMQREPEKQKKIQIEHDAEERWAREGKIFYVDWIKYVKKKGL